MATVGTPSKLLGSPINILAIRDDARNELEALLEGLHGQICLVVDPRLTPALKLIIVEGSKYMKEHRVDNILELSTGSISTECDTVLYLARPSLKLTELIASQVRSFQKRGIRKHLHLAYVPRKTFICEQLLKETGVAEDITVSEYGLDIIPLDDDVMTLGLDTCFRDAFVQGDSGSLLQVARALHKIQTVYGHIPSIRSKGPMAKTVLDLLLRMTREEDGIGDSSGAGRAAADRERERERRDLVSFTVGVGPRGGEQGAASATPPTKPEIDCMVIIDRSVDLVTPLVTPLTTEALFHELLAPGVQDITPPGGTPIGSAVSACEKAGIDFAMANVDMSVLAPQNEEEEGKSSAAKYAPGTKGVLHLNSNDKIYTEVRDLNVQAAGPQLTSKAKELQSFREQIKKSKNMEVSDIHAFVKAIPTLQQDSKSLRIMVDLLSQISTVANGEEFLSRWNMERGLLDEEGFKDVQEALSTWIAKRAPLVSVLRMLCLDSVVEGGLKASKLDGMRKELINSYGYELLFSLMNLEKAGLLTSREGRGLGGLLGGSAAWTTLRKALSLTVPEVDIEQPQDIHYVTAGYAPLSVRLIQSAVVGIQPLTGNPSSSSTAAEKPGWDSIADALKALPGPSIQITQVRRDPAAQQAIQQAQDSDGARKVCLAVFVGGCTHIEVSALRFLSERCKYRQLYPLDRRIII